MDSNFGEAAWREIELNTQETRAVQALAPLFGRTEHGRFGFAVLLKYFPYEGRFPEGCRAVPAEVMYHLAAQLEIGAFQRDQCVRNSRSPAAYINITRLIA